MVGLLTAGEKNILVLRVEERDMLENQKEIGWIKHTAQFWGICQYCKRNIYKGEKCWKIKGMAYVVCNKCHEERGGEM